MAKKKKKKSFIRTALAWLLWFFLIAVILSMFQVVLVRFMNPPVTLDALWKGVLQLWTVQPDSRTSSWRGLDEISPHMRRAVLAGEDQRFLAHHGFDLTE
ncbi:MAG: transglycosylase domain-containing protein, partial [Desulfobulbaceae bacterium]|nr:transglycosylase domain-containing protein [Desulfobulbaceae bacterium]